MMDTGKMEEIVDSYVGKVADTEEALYKAIQISSEVAEVMHGFVDADFFGQDFRTRLDLLLAVTSLCVAGVVHGAYYAGEPFEDSAVNRTKMSMAVAAKVRALAQDFLEARVN